jgi:hypothetical protein
LEVSEPIPLIRFTIWSPEYYTWKTKLGIYFIFLDGSLEYIGECTKGDDLLAGRIWYHCDTCPLMRRHIVERNYAVSFYVMTDRPAIKSLEDKLIKCDPVPYANRTLFKSQLPPANPS